MKYFLVLLAIPALMGETCKNKKAKGPLDGIPSCIQERIDSIKNEPKWNPPAQVNEYNYNGKTAFLFSSNCCDQFDELMDSDCNYVCAPTGGITGKGDGKCQDFQKVATHVRLVWKDPR
jgi:hypothetical protein